jgi:hypothetical protein
MLKNEDQSGNRGRDYLTSYPEIIARVYGELPIWRTAIFQQMDNLRERDLVQEAVREEITENLMTHEAMVALGGVDPIHEYKRVEENAWPYNMAESPIEAANKRVERAKQKVQQSIMDNARLRRREILLDILKKIKYYEEQINTVAKIDGQDGVDPDHAAQYKQELMKLQKMKVLVLNGAYDLEIDSAIQSVVSNFLLRDLRNTSNSVNDPNWKPPFTLLNKDGEEIKPAYSPGTEPMNYYEIKALSKHDQDWSQGPQKGMTLEEPKMMEMEFPPNTPGYQDTFNQELEPKYKARMSFNLRRFWKS